MSHLDSAEAAPPTMEYLRGYRDAIVEAARRRGAHNIRVFGSAASGEAHVDSDVDFLVDLKPRCGLTALGGLKVELESILGRSVDISTSGCIRAEIREEIIRRARQL